MEDAEEEPSNSVGVLILPREDVDLCTCFLCYMLSIYIYIHRHTYTYIYGNHLLA